MLSVLIVVILLIGGRLYQTDWSQRAVDNRLLELVELIEKDGSETPILALGKSNQMKQFFTDTASIEYLPNRSPLSGGQAFAATFLSFRGFIETLSLRVGSHEIQIDESKASATSDVSIFPKGTMKGGERGGGEKLRFEISWLKRDGDWLIARTRFIE